MSKKRSFPWAVVAGAAVAGASFVGVAQYVVRNPSATAETTIVAPKDRHTTPDTSSKPDNQTHEEGTVRIVQRDENDNAKIGSQKKVEKGVNPKVSALNQSLKNVGYENVRVVGIDFEGGNALIDISPGAEDSLGSSGEADFISVFKACLGQFSDVSTFQFRSDGQLMKTLGHLDLSEPIPVR